MTIPYIPYFQTSRYRVQTMIDLAEIKSGEKAADLGCGDGRISIALSLAGAITTAYELDEKLIQLAKENIKNSFFNRHSEHSKSTSFAEAAQSEESHSIKKDPSPLLHFAQDDKKTQMDFIPPTILKKDFWFENLSQYSIICCYPMPTIMGRLEKKLQEELKPGSRVLLNYFPFKHWKLEATKDNIFLYKK